MPLLMLAQPARGECLPPAGVIPIDRLTDVCAPVEVVTQRVSREQLERVYGFRLPKPEAEDDAPGRWGPLVTAHIHLKSGVTQV